MKLNEIKTVITGTHDLLEGVIPPHITMTLQQVVDAGEITNPVQIFMIAALVEMFKGGGPYRWPRELNSYEMSTNADAIEGIKNLTGKEAAFISAWLLDVLQKPAGFESNPYCNHPQYDTAEWVRWVQQAQE